MKSAYIDYSMSVIVSRALPDVRDGLKPVHRRILYGMRELGNYSNKPFKKAARTVGDVMGKYHPHGDSSIYMALVRMAQKWSLRYTMIEGQGNFGSIDGDNPAAMRYTEARLNKMAEEMLSDIDKDTVDFQPNYDDSQKEPTVLPTRLPNLLINGASGIAVGMATNMPPHNLTEAIDATIAYIDRRGEITVEELMEYVKAPDFPTKGMIYGMAGVRNAYETGRGRVVIRGKAEIETEHNRERIIITEIPYQVIKADMVRRIAELVGEKKLEGISDIRDESSRNGIRIVVEVKRDANAAVVLNKLYKFTDLQSSFSINNIALVKGRPRLLNLRDLIQNFFEHRHEVVYRRTQFELRKAQERAHILEGLIIASDNIDEVISIIRSSKTPQEAISRLIERFGLSEIQAKAIVEMRLRHLTGLEQEKLHAEYEELMKLIDHLNEILNNEEMRFNLIKDELIEIRDKYGDERSTEIIYASEELNPEDFYADDEMVITISHMGYIKRTPLTEFRAQARGGKGSKGSDTRSEDFVEHIYPASMHSTMMFFTQKGRCYWLKVYEIPEGSKNSKGRAIQNMLNIEQDDRVNTFIRVKKLNDEAFINSHYLFFCTKRGVIKRTLLKAYSHIRTIGVKAIELREDDELIQVRMTSGNEEILLANRNGRALHFNETAVRIMGRVAAGVRGMTLDEGDDEVVAMCTIKNKQLETIMVVSENGYGKRSIIEDYRITNRGGKGVKTISVTEKTGRVVTIKSVTDDDDLMIINKSGITLRLHVANIGIQGRATQGVRLINLSKYNDEIASVCKVISESEEDEETENTPEATSDATMIETTAPVLESTTDENN